MASQQLQSPQLVTFPDGVQRWRCPYCFGVYNNREAATPLENRHCQDQYHRCRSRPNRNPEGA